MKGEIDAAHKSLTAYNKSRTTVGKTRKAYRGSCKELIVYKVELERAKLEGGVKGGKEVEKLEGKVKKATAHMESACECVCSIVCQFGFLSLFLCMLCLSDYISTCTCTVVLQLVAQI